MIEYRIEIGGDYTGRTDMEVHFESELRDDDADIDYINSIVRELKVAVDKLQKVKNPNTASPEKTRTLQFDMISYRINIRGDDTGRTDMHLRFSNKLRQDNIYVDNIVNIARELNSALTKLHELSIYPHSDNKGKSQY